MKNVKEKQPRSQESIPAFFICVPPKGHACPALANRNILDTRRKQAMITILRNPGSQRARVEDEGPGQGAQKRLKGKRGGQEL